MMVVIYAIILVAVLTAWQGKRYFSISVFGVGMIVSICWFLHHVTTSIGLQL